MKVLLFNFSGRREAKNLMSEIYVNNVSHNS